MIFSARAVGLSVCGVKYKQRTAVPCSLLIRDGWLRMLAFLLSSSLRGEARHLSAGVAW